MKVPKYFTSGPNQHVERIKTVQFLIDILINNKRFMSVTLNYRNAILIGIERGILNFTVDFVSNYSKIASWELNSFIEQYKIKRYLLCSIISTIENGSFLENVIINRLMKWDDLVYAQAADFNPTKYKHVVENLSRRYNTSVVYSFIKGNYPCNGCGNYMYREVSQQTRSLDEPANYYRVCAGCGKNV